MVHRRKIIGNYGTQEENYWELWYTGGKLLGTMVHRRKIIGNYGTQEENK